jgi:hypothetical protein
VSDTTISQGSGRVCSLRSTSALKGFHNLSVIKAAVADEEGRARFVVSEEEILEWAALESTPAPGMPKIRVRVTTLDRRAPSSLDDAPS